MKQALPINDENLFLMFSPPLALNEAATMDGIIQAIKTKMGTVDVVVIDPIYFGMKGSLSDDEAVRNFTGQLRILQDTFNCACILAHHFKKARRDQHGTILTPDDDDVFGSVFFQAWITHQLLFDIDRVSQTRILQCNVQRSGKIMEKINLRMIEPEPLYFKKLDNFPTKGICLKAYFRDNLGWHSSPSIRKQLNMPKSTFYREVKILLEEGLVTRKSENGEYVFSWVKKIVS